MLGPFGLFLAWLIQEPMSTTGWKRGADGERRTAERLTKHLRGRGVRLLHDRRVPGHGRANIDHIVVGPAGILVIDSKAHRGKVKTDSLGGLFTPRRTVLLINGRDRSRLIDGVERQLGYVRAVLGNAEVEVRGALCFADPQGLPLFRQLTLRGVVIDGPKPIARLAARSGPLTAADIERIWITLFNAFPAA